MNIDEALYQLKQRIKMHELEGTTSNENEREKALLDYITKKQNKDLDRLNNIINRMEEDLREMYMTFGEFNKEYTEKKIRELKGE